MSALSGNPEAHMSMGYRYLHGIGVKPSCERALLHYEVAANEAVHMMGMHGGVPLHTELSKLSDGVLNARRNGQEFDESVSFSLYAYLYVRACCVRVVVVVLLKSTR
jgi:hypothetical protein